MLPLWNSIKQWLKVKRKVYEATLDGWLQLDGRGKRNGLDWPRFGHWSSRSGLSPVFEAIKASAKSVAGLPAGALRMVREVSSGWWMRPLSSRPCLRSAMAVHTENRTSLQNSRFSFARIFHGSFCFVRESILNQQGLSCTYKNK